MRQARHHIDPAWVGALACFVLAGATGVFFRVGLLTGLPAGLRFDHVRHAHSHLMYFGWVTPAIMALVAAHFSRPGRLQAVIRIVLLLAVLSYLPFLLYGYGLASLGAVRLPLSVILAGLNILGWYAFAGLYARRRGALHGQPARPFWDAALIFLVLASLGAWGLGIVQATAPDAPFWFAAALHLFLDLFADGWLLLGVVGLAVATTLPASESRWLRRGHRLLVVGLPVTFLLGMPVELVPPGLRLVGSAGGVLSGLGLLVVIATLWTRAEAGARRIWLVPLSLLVVKALAQLGLTVPALAEWAYGAGLRLLYLHVLLLGVVTLGLLAAAHLVWGANATPGRQYVTGAVLFLLLTLLPLTAVWPSAGRGVPALYGAVLGALAPVAAMAAVLVRTLWHQQHTPRADRRTRA